MAQQPIMKFRIFDKWLTVDELHGYGSEYATVALRESTEKNQPGKRVMLEPGMNRSSLITLAFDLLDVADKMQPSTTYATSGAVFCKKAEPEPANATFNRLARDLDEVRKDNTLRFNRLRERMNILQMCQRVLENCNDEVAGTLAALLLMADQSGDVPVRVSMAVFPAGAEEAINHGADAADTSGKPH